MKPTAVSVQQVCKSFRGEPVLRQVTARFPAGEIHGIIGRNGSGKTVLMKCILGFLKPDSGTIQVLGTQLGASCSFAPDTGMMIETPGFLPQESGLNNLLWLAKLRGRARREELEALLTRVGLPPRLKKPVGKYSLGMRQRLGIAQALMESPRLLGLDEPMNGLDRQGVEDIRALLLELRGEGTTILLSSHYAEDIDALCDTVWEMQDGELRYCVGR